MRKARSAMVKKKRRIDKENFVVTTSSHVALEGPHKEPEVRTDQEGIFIDKETGNLNIHPVLDMSFRNDEFNDFGIRLAGFTQSPTDRQYLESLSFNKFMRLFHNQAMYLNHMAGYLGSSTDSIMKVNKELDGDLKKAQYAKDIALKKVKIFEGEIDALKKTAAESKKKVEEELKKVEEELKKVEEELKKTKDELATSISVNKSMLAEIEDLKIQLEQAKASSVRELIMSEIPARYEPSDKFYQLMIDLGQKGFEMLQRALLRHPSLDSAAKTIVESMDFDAVGQEEIDMEKSVPKKKVVRPTRAARALVGKTNDVVMVGADDDEPEAPPSMEAVDGNLETGEGSSPNFLWDNDQKLFTFNEHESYLDIKKIFDMPYAQLRALISPAEQNRLDSMTREDSIRMLNQMVMKSLMIGRELFERVEVMKHTLAAKERGRKKLKKANAELTKSLVAAAKDHAEEKKVFLVDKQGLIDENKRYLVEIDELKFSLAAAKLENAGMCSEGVDFRRKRKRLKAPLKSPLQFVNLKSVQTSQASVPLAQKMS